MNKSLFISYDGLTDPLGQSQIIPYMKGLSSYGYGITILSAEKKERFIKLNTFIQQLLDKDNIKWETISFTTSPPIFSKLIDIYKLKREAERLFLKHKYDIIHCRSYQAIEIGVYLKNKYGVKVLFDMRGFWVDERVDGGLWNLNNPLFKMIYTIYKRKEQKFINKSDCIISLTETGKKEIQKWKGYNKCTINVIPCCSDFNHFSLQTHEEYVESRKYLGFKTDDFIVSYLGSLGTWYLLDEMLLLFKELKKVYSNAKFLFITKEPEQLVFDKLGELNLSKNDIKVIEATREQVPFFTKASDINLSFIKPSYSKMASSPTKLGEVLAMGIPVICNNIGDVKSIIEETDSGICIDKCNSKNYKKIVMGISRILDLNKNKIRENAFNYYDLERGNKLYIETYKKMLS